MEETSPTGFDGFMAYRTNVDAAIAEADQIAASAPVAPATRRPSAAQAVPKHRDSGAMVSGLKKLAGWVIGIGLIIAVKAFIFTGISSVTSGAPATSSAPATTYDAAPSLDTPSAKTTSDWSNSNEVSPSTEAAAPAEPSDDGMTLTKPEVGGGTLTIAELRYCEAEKIRIAAENSAMDVLQTSDVARFNSHVEDFNAAVSDADSRCSNRSYAVADKSLADSQIEAQRLKLEAEGRSRVD